MCSMFVSLICYILNFLTCIKCIINFQPRYIMPGENHQFQRTMRDCMLLRNHNCTSFIELEVYFEFMYQTILKKDSIFSCGSKQISQGFFHKAFFKAFEHFSQLQASKYYLYMLQTVHYYVNCNRGKSGFGSCIILESRIPTSQQFAVDIIKKGFFNNTQKNHSLQMDRRKCILLLKSENNPYDLEINLQNYIVRESKSNQKGKSLKQFLIVKAGPESTPDQIRFAMKNVYEFPQFYGDLWNFVLQIHGNKLKKIIDELSEGGPKKGYAQIVLLYNQNAMSIHQSSRKQLKNDLQEHKSVYQFQYLDTNHPGGRVSQEICSKVGSKEDILPGHFVWGNEWIKLPNGHLKNVNYEYISIQRAAVKKVIKKIMSMGSGESEMPIQMFSNESNLSQLARSCKYFSYFFDKKGQKLHQTEAIVIDGFKKIFCSIIGFLLIRNRMQKPIQPFLGETYQGFIDGFPIALQQIGRNKSYILFETQQIRLYGCLQLKTGISGINSITAGSEGYLTLQLIRYKKSPKIMFTIPMIELSGLLYGDRLVHINDESVIYEQQNRRLCCLRWGKNKNVMGIGQEISGREDFVEGEIVRLREGKMFQMGKYIKNSEYGRQMMREKNVERVYGQVYGNWTMEVHYRGSGGGGEGEGDRKGESIFKVDEQRAGELYHYVQPLPSDSRNRKDVRLLEVDKITEAERERRRAGEMEGREEKIRVKNRKR